MTATPESTDTAGPAVETGAPGAAAEERVETVALSAFPTSPGARRARRRLGRGPGSGRGKTCGRGTKGQKSRSGTALGGFEGGQMPIHMRMPKRGFRNAPFRKRPVGVNLGRLQEALDAGKLDAANVVDEAALIAAGVVRRAPDGVRILGEGEIRAALQLIATGISRAALAAVEKAGGSFRTVSGAPGADSTEGEETAT